MRRTRQSGKPEQVIGKIVDGQVAKWQKEICLLDQTWVKDPEGKKDIRGLLTDLVAHWHKRSRGPMERHLRPTNLDRQALKDLFTRYGGAEGDAFRLALACYPNPPAEPTAQ